MAVSNQDVRLLSDYRWPGNVRELSAVIDRAVLLGQGTTLEVAAALGRSPAGRVSSPAAASDTGGPAIVSLDEAIRRHIEAALVVERVLPDLMGKPLAMNVSGAIPAVLLDAGFPLGALKGVPLLARTASLIAHLLEEQQRSIGFILAHEGSSAISYDGEAPEGFVPGKDA